MFDTRVKKFRTQKLKGTRQLKCDFEPQGKRSPFDLYQKQSNYT